MRFKSFLRSAPQIGALTLAPRLQLVDERVSSSRFYHSFGDACIGGISGQDAEMIVDPSTNAAKWIWQQKIDARGILRRSRTMLVIDADNGASFLVDDLLRCRLAGVSVQSSHHELRCPLAPAQDLK